MALLQCSYVRPQRHGTQTVLSLKGDILVYLTTLLQQLKCVIERTSSFLTGENIGNSGACSNTCISVLHVVGWTSSNRPVMIDARTSLRSMPGDIQQHPTISIGMHHANMHVETSGVAVVKRLGNESVAWYVGRFLQQKVGIFLTHPRRYFFQILPHLSFMLIFTRYVMLRYS
jgi:hypothetical protein